MNGRELVERMKKINPVLKVVYTSGYTSNTIAHHNVLDQGIELIEKPVSADVLLRKIREILDR